MSTSDTFDTADSFDTDSSNAFNPFPKGPPIKKRRRMENNNNHNQNNNNYNFTKRKRSIPEQQVIDGTKYNIKIMNEWILPMNTFNDNEYKCSTIYICSGHIVNFSGEAIVNAETQGGCGVDGVISSAGGHPLYYLRKQLPLIDNSLYKRCNVGDAQITLSGYPYNKLKCDYVIHTVGPNYSHSNSDNMNEMDKLLYNCYKKSMLLAKTSNIKSICFSLISSNIFRGQQTLSNIIKCGINAITEYSYHDLEVFIIAYKVDELYELNRESIKILGKPSKIHNKIKKDNDNNNNNNNNGFQFTSQTFDTDIDANYIDTNIDESVSDENDMDNSVVITPGNYNDDVITASYADWMRSERNKYNIRKEENENVVHPAVLYDTSLSKQGEMSFIEPVNGQQIEDIEDPGLEDIEHVMDEPEFNKSDNIFVPQTTVTDSNHIINRINSKTFSGYVLDSLNDFENKRQSNMLLSILSIVFVILIVMNYYMIVSMKIEMKLDIPIFVLVISYITNNFGQYSGNGGLCILLLFSYGMKHGVKYMVVLMNNYNYIVIYLINKHADKDYNDIVAYLINITIYGCILVLCYYFIYNSIHWNAIQEQIFNRGSTQRIISSIIYIWFNAFMVVSLYMALDTETTDLHKNQLIAIIIGYESLVAWLWFRLHQSTFILIGNYILIEFISFFACIIVNVLLLDNQNSIGQGFVLWILVIITVLHDCLTLF